MEDHGGTIELESVARARHHRAHPPAARRPHDGDGSGSCRGRARMKGRILVVDDEPRQRDILRMILEAEGYETGHRRQRAPGALGRARAAVRRGADRPQDARPRRHRAAVRAAAGPAGALRHPHDRARHHRQRGRGHAQGRVRLPDEAAGEGRAAAHAAPRHGAQPASCARTSASRSSCATASAWTSIVGAHGSMQDVFRIVHKVAASSSTVLIYGESGTGKELIARALHLESDRRAAAVLRGQRGGPAREHPGGGALRPREGRLHRRRERARSGSSSRPPGRPSSWTRWATSSATCR